MLILALDTTTRAGSVAVTRDGLVLALVPGDASRTHGERLPAEIASALDQAGVAREAIDLFAVAAGPGGFTGLRIGLAAVQGLAMTLNKPVAGVATLEALAEQASGTSARFIIPWMDAQRGDVFATVIDARTHTVVESPVAERPAAILDSWRTLLRGQQAVFIGDAVTRDAALIEAHGEGLWEMRSPGPLAPDISTLAARMAAQGKAGPPHALEPMYVRRPDAEIDRDKRRPIPARPERNAADDGGSR